MIRSEVLADPTPAVPVLRELRAALDTEVFTRRLKAACAAGYQVIAGYDDDTIVAALGYRIAYDICWGKTLYVDDLIVTDACRGKGVGGVLMDRAIETARALGCDHVRLCSGLTRTDAHRFYEAQGMTAFSKQFVLALSGDH